MRRATVVAMAVLLMAPGVAEAAAKRPDLVVTKLSAPPASVVAGHGLTVTATVRNAGRGRAPATLLAAVLSTDAKKGKGARRSATSWGRCSPPTTTSS